MDYSEDESNNDDVLRNLVSFLQKGCGCSSGPEGSQCSQQFSEPAAELNIRNMLELTSSELDLVILANIQVFSRNEVSGEKRARSSRCNFTYQTKSICKDMFLRLYGISYSRFLRLREHYEINGVCPRQHGNTKRLPWNKLSQSTLEDVKAFIANYVEENAVVLPGRIPGFKNDGIKLLPSNDSKSSVWQDYSRACEASDKRPVSYRTFVNLWAQFYPDVMIAKPRTDLCPTCQDSSTKLQSAANSDEEKAECLRRHQEHLQLARSEREQYKEVRRKAMEALDSRPDDTAAWKGPMHYSFDYAQVVEKWEYSREKRGIPAETELEPEAAAKSIPQPDTTDPYEQFLSEQAAREAVWQKKREKRTVNQTTADPFSQDTCHATADKLRQQLAVKTKESDTLKEHLSSLQQTLERAVMVIEGLQCSVVGMASTLQSCEGRLGVLESTVANLAGHLASNPSNDTCTTSEPTTREQATLPSHPVMEISHSADDLETIDMEAFANLSENQEPIQKTPIVPCLPLQPCPTASSIPAPRPAATTVPVPDELIHSCVTPRKVNVVREILSKETKERHLCALKLLPKFFNEEELQHCNCDGTYGKEALDSTRLNALKVLLFTRFPLQGGESEERKAWNFVKSRLNSKCRAKSFGSKLNVAADRNL